MAMLDHSTNGLSTDKGTLYMFGGAALMLLGAPGLILSIPVVRRYLGDL
jgi:hypothetical protein